jgi:hypothetical protein
MLIVPNLTIQTPSYHNLHQCEWLYRAVEMFTHIMLTLLSEDENEKLYRKHYYRESTSGYIVPLFAKITEQYQK